MQLPFSGGPFLSLSRRRGGGGRARKETRRERRSNPWKHQTKWWAITLASRARLTGLRLYRFLLALRASTEIRFEKRAFNGDENRDASKHLVRTHLTSVYESFRLDNFEKWLVQDFKRVQAISCDTVWRVTIERHAWFSVDAKTLNIIREQSQIVRELIKGPVNKIEVSDSSLRKGCSRIS